MADTSSVYSRPSRRAGEEPVEGPKKPAPVEVQSTTYTRVTRTVEPREALRPVARRLPALNYRNVALGIGLLSIVAYMLLRSTTLPAAPVVHKPTIKDKATEGYEKLQETLGAAKERAAEGMDYAKGHMDDLQYRLGLKKKPETRLEYVWHMIRDTAYAPFGWAQQRVWNMYDWVTHFGRPTKAKLHVESTLDEAKLKAERAKNLAKEKLMEGGDLAKEKLHDAGRSAESLGERLKDSAKETVGELKDRVYEMPGRVAEGTDRLKEKAYEYAHGAKETVHEAKLSAESLAEKAAHRAEEKLHDAERTGATVAERAGDYLKETYTAVKDSVLEAGAKLQQTADSIKETVIETKDSAKEKLHDAVRAKDSAAEKAADYAREKYEALKDRAAEGVLAGKEKLHEAKENLEVKMA